MAMIVPRGWDEVRQAYGDVRVVSEAGATRIVYPGGQDAWERKNCIVVRDLPGFGPRPLYVHRLMAEPLRRAMARAKAACPDYLIRTLGCFNPRVQRGSESALSLHALAAAVDLNADTNPRGAPLRTDMPPAFVAAFKAEGFIHGAGFRVPDAMHWQLAAGV